MRAGGVIIIALALAGCYDRAPDGPAEALAAKQHEEDAAAGYMLRLGYDRWTAACAYDSGLKHRSQADALKACVVDFHFTGPITGQP